MGATRASWEPSPHGSWPWRGERGRRLNHRCPSLVVLVSRSTVHTVRKVGRELVELSRQGDRVAFGELAITLGDRLHAVAHRILRDRDLAGDVTQQALVKIWQELPKLRDADLFDGWSYRVLVNTCRDEMRKRRGPSADLGPAGERCVAAGCVHTGR